MTRSPNPVPGILGGAVAGLVVAWLSLMAVSYASGNLMQRLIRYKSDGSSLTWAVAIVVIALVVGGLMSVRQLAAGAMIGAGLLWSVVGLALQVLPIRQAVDLSKLFEAPGRPAMRSTIVWDGSVLFLGVLLLALGAARLVHDARLRQPRVQDTFAPGQPGPYQQPGLYPPPSNYPQDHNPQPGNHQNYPPR